MAKILIVDDDRTSIQLLSDLLSFAGHTPTFLVESDYLFPKLDSNPVDLILLDIYMPKIDGVSLLRQIKNHPTYQTIPVIMITGQHDELILSACFNLGAMDFIGKPVNKLELEARVKTALETRKYISELANLNEELENRVQERAKELEDSHERFITVLDSLDVLIYVADMETYEVLYANQYARNLWGDIIGKTCWQTLQSDQTKPCSFCTNDRLLTAKGKPKGVYNWEFQNTNNGRWYDIHDRAIRWVDGRIVRLEIATDITERKRMEEGLRKLSRAVEQSPSTVIITDTKGIIEYVNPKFTQISGYTPEEAIGKSPSIVKSGETTPEEYQRLWEAIISGGEWQGEFHNRKKDGTFFWEFAIISSIKNKEGEITHFLAIKEDITTRKLMEERAKRQQEQLIQADKMISLGTLVAGMAHEVNNPNNSIALNASNMEKIWKEANHLIISGAKTHHRKTMANMPVKEALEIFDTSLSGIKKGSDRIQKIVLGLKDFARAEASGYQNEVDARMVINSSIKFTESIFKEFACQLTTSVPELPPIKGNFLKLEQVLVNLLINACQSLDDCVKSIEIDANHDKAKEHISIRIKDQGVGMGKETLRRVMEPFFTTKQDSGGTGLGVSISYGIIQEHGGSMQYESEPGKGTSVTITLPVATNSGCEKRV